MTTYSNFMAIAIILIWLSVIIIMFIGAISGYIYEKRFYIVVRNLLSTKSFNLNNCVNSIRNNYEVYRRHRFGFANKKIIPICQDCASNLRLGIGLDSVKGQYKYEAANRLEEIIKQLQYEEQFDDEKANEIIEQLDGKISNEIIGQVKQKLVFLEAYHKGILSVKNLEILELKDKIKRRSWITWITGTIGIVGSVASIISIFK